MINLLMSSQVAYRQTIEERIAQQGGIQGDDDSLWSGFESFLLHLAGFEGIKGMDGMYIAHITGL